MTERYVGIKCEFCAFECRCIKTNIIDIKKCNDFLYNARLGKFFIEDKNRLEEVFRKTCEG
jgi:hypothetical protein